jgi:hypothetical protein
MIEHVLGAVASAALAMAPAKAPPPPKPPPLLWDVEYRLRLTAIDLDQQPQIAAGDADRFVDHRLRLGVTAPVHPKFTVRGRLTTQASRWGDFDPATVMFAVRRFDFDQLHAIWTPTPDLAIIPGRGNNRYFEVDLAAATGRFNEDDIQYEGVVVQHKPAPKTTLIGAYGIVLATNQIDFDPREFRLDGALVQVRQQFTPEHRLLVHAGSLYPHKSNFVFPGKQRGDLAVVRYDWTPRRKLSAFAMASRPLDTVDTFTFQRMTPEAADDRNGFFGGVLVGDKEVVNGDQFEVYFTRTGQGAQGITTEFPNNIREYRGLWERQVAPRIWTRVSGVHRQLNRQTAVFRKNDQDTVFAQVLAKF